MTTEKLKHIIIDKLPWFITGFITILLVGSYFLFPGYEKFIDNAFEILTSGDRDRISNWVKGYGFWGPIVIVLAMVVQMFTLVINSVLLILIAILAYGKIWGSLLGLLSVIVASSVGYVIGRMIGESAIEKILGKSTEKKVYDKVSEYGVWAVVIARLSPFLSNDAISFVTGLVRMNYFKFMAATIAGISPLILLMAWLEEDWERLKSALIWVSAISLLGFAVYVFFQYRKKKSE